MQHTKTTGTEPKITETSREVFIAYAKDAPNWSGTPLVGGNVGGTKQERGNLTQLKRAGLIETPYQEDGHRWIRFTEAGVEYAHALGISIDGEPIAATTVTAPESAEETPVMTTPETTEQVAVPESFSPRHTRAGWAMYRVSGGPRERVTAYFATAAALAKNVEADTADVLSPESTETINPVPVPEYPNEGPAPKSPAKAREAAKAIAEAASKAQAEPKPTAKPKADKPVDPQAALRAEHRTTWFYWDASGKPVQHTASMSNKGVPGRSAKCSCGWETQNGPESNQKVAKAISEHRLDVGIAAKATPFRSAYDGKMYADEIEAKRAEYEAETGERPSRAVASIFIDRERDAENAASDTPTVAVVETPDKLGPIDFQPGERVPSGPAFGSAELQERVDEIVAERVALDPNEVADAISELPR